jgi:predicted metal-dependent HD superfamily phosphohydrolase
MDPNAESLLRPRWVRLLTTLGCPADRIEPAFTDLRERYESSDRHYHTLDHIRAVLDAVCRLGATEEMSALLLAAWFHDAIYDSHASDNEERSAAFARRALQSLGVVEVSLREIERLILLTKNHSPSPDDLLGQILVDADLAVLGAPEAEYDAYARAIRKEYAWVPDEDYRAGRRGVLEHFLHRPRIYWTASMFAEAEGAARRNLRREIEWLS